MRIRSIFFFILLTSCSYHLGRSQNPEKIIVNVPYVQGDYNGLFTNELIRQISYSANLNYKYSDANYFLKVEIISDSTSQIGYKYDRDNNNERCKTIRATEGRQTIAARISLIECSTNLVKFGPFDVKADSEFDYVDPDSLNDLSFINAEKKRVTVLSYSLGQLESIENAKEAALKPLYESLSKKIVDAILAYW
ncbi:MAG: hypothetical protein ACD_20C00278G0002 [uncultured bacterium]|nr:MAG: hypothetical protein ACD_20C00278G0002 [uncultured bacterium]